MCYVYFPESLCHPRPALPRLSHHPTLYSQPLVARRSSSSASCACSTEEGAAGAAVAVAEGPAPPGLAPCGPWPWPWPAARSAACLRAAARKGSPQGKYHVVPVSSLGGAWERKP